MSTRGDDRSPHGAQRNAGSEGPGFRRGAPPSGLRTRREFITVVGAAAVCPLAARAQQSLPVVGFLGLASPVEFAQYLRAFQQGLRESGYVEGRNVTVEYRWAEGRNDRLSGLAADLVRRQVDVIATSGGLQAALAAKQASSTIPIVFETAADPVAVGLVESLNRPHRNITGITTLNAEVAPKRIELLRELLPNAAMIALLIVSGNPNNPEVESSMRSAARVLGLDLHVMHINEGHDIATAFTSLKEQRVDGVVVSPNPYFTSRIQQVAALAIQHALPAIYHVREFAAAGGLMSYGASVAEAHRLSGVYTGRVLKGEKAGDLPVQQATNVELVINLKTAKALGLTVPLSLRSRADEVIE
jgi:putative ABC transport system substrate-binding protein